MNASWQHLTVQQFQDIYRLSLSTNLDDMSKVERAIAILFNMTESQVGELTISDFSHYATQCSFLFNEEVPGKCVRYIKTGRKKYGIQYEPRKLRQRQYVEVVTFSEKPIENMHLIMASLVQPIKWGFIWKENSAKEHEDIAEDMLNARVIDVYHSCVFFCKLFAGLIGVIQGSLVAGMMRKGITKEQAEILVNTSKSAMDGFIQQSKLQTITI